MADAPFDAVGVAEQSGGGEEEPAPATHPQRGVAAVELTKNALDLVTSGIEIGEPVERGALVVGAAPAPFLFDLEQIGILPDQMMARHHAAGEEMLRDPVLPVVAIEQISAGTMGEDVHEEAAIGRQPGFHPRHQLAPVHHVLEHFDRYDAVELPPWIEHIHVRGNDAKIFQSAYLSLALDILPLRLRIRHRDDSGFWKLPRHP